MNDLVKIIKKDGYLVVTSRQVARDFQKEHRAVLKAVDDLIAEMGVAQNYADLFIPSEYQHEQNKQIYREYLLTRDGFSLLVMGFTGKNALDWKLKYIAAFNKMEKVIKSQQIIPSNLSPELRFMIKMELKQNQMEQELATAKTQVAIAARKAQVLEHRVNNLDATNIDGTPRQRLNDMVKKYAYENGILYPQAWKEFRSNFNTAYRTNIELKKSNYLEKHNIKQMSYPEYLERVGLIEDALRVADKMLNQSKTA